LIATKTTKKLKLFERFDTFSNKAKSQTLCHRYDCGHHDAIVIRLWNVSYEGAVNLEPVKWKLG
jgi:hypothetical protein